MTLNLNHKILLLFILISTFILFNFVLVINSEDKASKQYKWVVHTHEVIESSQRFLGYLRDAETGQRGYLLTQTSDYLVSYNKGKNKAVIELNLLFKLTQDNKTQQTRLHLIKKLMKDKLDELNKTLKSSKNKKVNEALSLVISNIGKNIMDKIRLHIKDFIALENQLLESRNLEYLASIQKTKNIFIIMAILLFTMIAFIGIWLQKKLAGPILELQNHITKISDNTYADNNEINIEGNDEISRLANAFNTMNKKVISRTIQSKNIENSLKLIIHELRESENYNKMLFENTPIGLALTNMKGELIDINQTYANITGYNIEELQKLSYWDLTPQKYEEDETKQLESLERTGEYGPYEKEYIHKDGSLIAVRLSGQLIYRNGEKFIWSSVEDISEKKKHEENLQHSKELLENEVETRTREYKEAKEGAEIANLAKSQFLSSMSHELRTPLNAILGFSQLLRINEKDDLKNSNILEIIHAGEHLLNLINQILDLSKIEAGSIEVSIKSLNFHAMLNSCLSLIQTIADKNSIKINNKTSSLPNTYIDIDETRFKQIILNLLSNAVKYNSENGTIIIDAYPDEENFLHISISDTGKGLSPEQQDKIFIAFERFGKEHTDIEGSGLGLVITKDLVELMGGRIGLESELGKGSCFWIKIPLSDT